MPKRGLEPNFPSTIVRIRRRNAKPKQTQALRFSIRKPRRSLFSHAAILTTNPCARLSRRKRQDGDVAVKPRVEDRGCQREGPGVPTTRSSGLTGSGAEDDVVIGSPAADTGSNRHWIATPLLNVTAYSLVPYDYFSIDAGSVLLITACAVLRPESSTVDSNQLFGRQGAKFIPRPALVAAGGSLFAIFSRCSASCLSCSSGGSRSNRARASARRGRTLNRGIQLATFRAIQVVTQQSSF
jgi:hypothetical protein